MEQAGEIAPAESLGGCLYESLLAALSRIERPAHIDLAVGPPGRGLVLRCDAALCPPDSGPLRVIAGADARDLVGGFIDALARGPARGIVFRASTSARAVFRGGIGRWSLRLAVAERGSRANSCWNDPEGAASMAPVSPRWRLSW